MTNRTVAMGGDSAEGQTQHNAQLAALRCECCGKETTFSDYFCQHCYESCGRGFHTPEDELPGGWPCVACGQPYADHGPVESQRCARVIGEGQ